MTTSTTESVDLHASVDHAVAPGKLKVLSLARVRLADALEHARQHHIDNGAKTQIRMDLL